MPIYKPPSSFPGLDRLPPMVRTLVERAFPQTPEMPTPVGTTIGPLSGGVPAALRTAASRAGGSVQDMLNPTAKGIMEKMFQQANPVFKKMQGSFKNRMNAPIKDPMTAQEMLAMKPHPLPAPSGAPGGVKPPIGKATVGPNAIPLDAPGDYLKQASSTAMKDLSSVPQSQMLPGVAHRGGLMRPAMDELKEAIGSATNPQQKDALYQQLVNRLADVFHGPSR